MLKPSAEVKRCASYLERLCLDIPQRPVGSSGNQEATAFFQDQVEKWGWEVISYPIQALDWEEQGAELILDQESFSVFPSPYSKGVDVRAELVQAKSIRELKDLPAKGKLLLITGDLAAEQLMPKNFVFYNPDHHQTLIALLEEKQPAAILAAVGPNPELAGGLYPYPLIEDGDFEIPSVYLTEAEGDRLSRRTGRQARLLSRAARQASRGEQLIARRVGSVPGRIVISAHIDAKLNSPGALDNATGVIILLLLAEHLADVPRKLGIDLVPFNGEDYFSAPGQMVYLKQSQDEFQDILLNINLDGAGYHQGHSVISPLQCPPGIQKLVESMLSKQQNLSLGKPWYQGDHSIFLQKGIPALAVTSSWLLEHIHDQQITHTPRDHPRIIDCDQVVDIARFLHLLMDQFDEHYQNLLE